MVHHEGRSDFPGKLDRCAESCIMYIGLEWIGEIQGVRAMNRIGKRIGFQDFPNLPRSGLSEDAS